MVLRHPETDDIHRTLDLLLRCRIPEYGLDVLRQEWSAIDLAEDAWLAFTGEGSLVGYATIEPYHTGLCYHVYVDPAWKDPTLTRMLLQACDRRASARIAAQAEPAEATVTTWISHVNERDRQAIKEVGFRLVKSSLEMRIEMQRCPPAPRGPEEIEIRCAGPGQDDLAICELMEEVFAGTHLEPTSFVEWREAWIDGAYFDAELWFLAVHREEIIGACLCAVYPEQQQAWVRQVGVTARWQRHGVGKMLLLSAFRAFYARGHGAVHVGVEADNTAALRLYEHVGMRRRQQYDEYQKRIGWA
jgi:ribosomal protein S18 acetylase RimI-like enzyme